MKKNSLILIFLFVVSGCFYYAFTLDSVEVIHAVVVEVIDGDTFVLDTGEKIRLLGINTPERNQPFYGDAKNVSSSLVLNRTVSVHSRKNDKYGRMLAYVFSDEVLVNEVLVLQGYATSYYYEVDEYGNRILSAEEYARSNRLGLWKNASFSSCINLLGLKYLEDGNRCSNREVLRLYNSCNRSFELTIKDDATHIVRASVSPYSLYEKNFSCVFNDAGDSLYVYDNSGLFVFYRY